MILNPTWRLVFSLIVVVAYSGLSHADFIDIYNNDVENGYHFEAGNTYYVMENITVGGNLAVDAGAIIDFNPPHDEGGDVCHTMVVDDVVSVQIGEEEGDRAVFRDIRSIQITAEDVDILNADFETPNQANNALEFDSVQLLNCDDSVIAGCSFDHNGDRGTRYALRIDGGDFYRVEDCEIDSEDRGVIVDDGDLNFTCVVRGCLIDAWVRGIVVDDLTNTGEGWEEDDYPVRIHQNVISGHNGAVERAGIYTDDTPYASVLIVNNVIRGFPRGISVQHTGGGAGGYPHIFNNAIFNCGVGCYARDIFDDGDEDPTDGLQIRNNTVWDCYGPYGTGFWLDFDNDASMDNLDFANNIIGECGIGVDIDATVALEDFGSIGYNAFKDIVGNDYILFNGDDEDGDAILTESCVIHDPNGGEWVDLRSENPSAQGWDFHILMDDIVAGEDPDLNMDLVDTGHNLGLTWRDPGYGEEAHHGRPIPNRRHLRRCYSTDPDMGIYGGPYARDNIDVNLTPQEDFIIVDEGVNAFQVDLPIEYYVFAAFLQESVPGIGEVWHVEPGTIMDFGDNVVEIAGAIQVAGGADTMGVSFLFDDGYLKLTADTDVDSSYLIYCDIYDSDYGIKLAGVDDTGGDRIDIDHCSIYDCGIGIYANNSRVEITNCTITNCDVEYSGKGIYLKNCTAGQVIIDGNSITENGTGGTYSSAGIYLHSSDAEIINNLIEDNTGCGIACIGSSPDLNTYDTEANPNDIHSNGTGSQSSSDGAEIYLASSSYPGVNYNNIWDYDTGPIGYMIYKDASTNGGSLNAKFNWWGVDSLSVTDDFFYWGSGSAINYTPAYGSKIDSREEFELAMRLWGEGRFEEAARYFSRTVGDTGAVGVNSVHYLTGCVGEMDGGDFRQLRGFFQDLAEDHRDERVAPVAERFATHCLTEMREYEDAMAEYDDVRRNADCLHDSVMAVIDYLAVAELAGLGDEADAFGEDIPHRMSRLMALLRERTDAGVVDVLLPEDFIIAEAYPNPFNVSTTITYNLAASGSVRLSIHDLEGREVALLHDGTQLAGLHSVAWDATGLPSGFYLCRMETAGRATTLKLAIVR